MKGLEDYWVPPGTLAALLKDVGEGTENKARSGCGMTKKYVREQFYCIIPQTAFWARIFLRKVNLRPTYIFK